jgi:hypothetical protein
MIFVFPSWPGEDPAIQFHLGAAPWDLDHRLSLLRGGPVMTEKIKCTRQTESSCLHFSCRTVVDLVRPSTSFHRRGRNGSGKFLDGRAKQDHDDLAE